MPLEWSSFASSRVWIVLVIRLHHIEQLLSAQLNSVGKERNLNKDYIDLIGEDTLSISFYWFWPV